MIADLDVHIGLHADNETKVGNKLLTFKVETGQKFTDHPWPDNLGHWNKKLYVNWKAELGFGIGYLKDEGGFEVPLEEPWKIGNFRNSLKLKFQTPKKGENPFKLKAEAEAGIDFHVAFNLVKPEDAKK